MSFKMLLNHNDAKYYISFDKLSVLCMKW